MADINLSLSDPVSADVQAVCNSLTAVSNFLCTPQGQALVEQAIKDSAAFRSVVESVWNAVLKLFHKN